MKLFKRKPGGSFFGNLFRSIVSEFGGPVGKWAINRFDPVPPDQTAGDYN